MKQVFDFLNVKSANELCAYCNTEQGEYKFEIYKKQDIQLVETSFNHYVKWGNRWDIKDGSSYIYGGVFASYYVNGVHNTSLANSKSIVLSENNRHEFMQFVEFAKSLDNAFEFAQTL